MSGFVFGSLVVLSHQEALEQMRVYSQRLLHLEELSLLVFLVYNLCSMQIFLRNSQDLDWIAKVGDLLALQSVVFVLHSVSRSSFMVFCLARRCWRRWSFASSAS